MDTVGSVLPDSIKKTMPPAASSQPCNLHGLDMPDETVTIGSLTISVPRQCPACVDERKQIELCNKQVEEQTVRVLVRRQAGVPERYLNKSLGDFREETPAQKCVGEQLRVFVNGGWEGSPGLLFLGSVGTAKTMLGAALANHWLDYHGRRSARFYTMLELVRRVKATWGQDSVETEPLAYQRLADLPLLIIDEIGVQFGSQAERTIFSEVINRRYNALQPTILIGNLTLDECVEVLGERVVDRFRDGGHTLVFNWSSQRGMKRPEDLKA